EMADDDAVGFFYLDAVGARMAARELDRDAGLRERPAGHERQAPDLLRARDRDVGLRVAVVERDAVRRGRVVDDALERSVLAEAKHPPRRIGDPGLPLVGEVQIAVVREVQVVEALEALAERGLDDGLDAAAPRVEEHQPALVVGDEDAPVLVDLQPVRPAVVLNDEVPFALRVDAEDAPEGDVDAPQVAVAVERRALEEAVDLGAAAV